MEIHTFIHPIIQVSVKKWLKGPPPSVHESSWFTGSCTGRPFWGVNRGTNIQWFGTFIECTTHGTRQSLRVTFTEGSHVVAQEVVVVGARLFGVFFFAFATFLCPM